MAFESKHADLLQRIEAQFGLPTTGPAIEPWTRRAMEQFKFSDPAQNWGCKSTSAGSPVSDAFAIGEASRMLVYDCVISAGSPAASLNLHPEELVITDQHFIPVSAVNHLGGSGPTHTCRMGPSLFWGLGGQRHGWPELGQQFAEYRDAKADFVRTFIHLNSSDPRNPWKRIGAHVDDADLEDLIQRYSDHAERYGLKVQWVLTGGIDDLNTEEKQDKLCARVANALRNRLHRVEFFEVMNEYLVNGGSTHMLRHMYRRLRSAVGPEPIISLSSPNCVMGGNPTQAEIDDEVFKMYAGLTGKLAITPHWNRTPGHEERHRPPNLGPHAPSIVICNEPRGPKSSVIDTHDPNVIVGDYKAAADAGYYAYVPHSDSGVWSVYITDEYKTPERGQWPVFSRHTNGPAILQALKLFRETGSGGSGGGGGGVIPYDEAKSVEFGLACNDVYNESGATPDPGMVSVHSSRAAWDFYVGGMAWADSKKKHVNEFRAEYGLPPV